MGLKTTTECLGDQTITDLSSAVGLTVPAGATWCLIAVENAAVRYRDKGIPTASIGLPLPAGAFLEYDGDLNSIKFINQSSAAKLSIVYYR